MALVEGNDGVGLPIDRCLQNKFVARSTKLRAPAEERLHFLPIPIRPSTQMIASAALSLDANLCSASVQIASYGPQTWCRGQDSNLRRFLSVREAVSTTHTTPALTGARARTSTGILCLRTTALYALSYACIYSGAARGTSTRISVVRTDALFALS